MELLVEIIARVPWWVFALFAYFFARGVKARRPGDTSLVKLAVMPGLLLVLGVNELWHLFGFDGPETLIWLAGLAIGAVVGSHILRDAEITVDRSRGVIHRPADMTVLPLVLIIFAVKFAFGMMVVVAPDLIQQPLVRFLDIGSSGLFGGIFVGKFYVYGASYLRATPADLRT
jgi:hypothetical protein